MSCMVFLLKLSEILALGRIKIVVSYSNNEKIFQETELVRLA